MDSNRLFVKSNGRTGVANMPEPVPAPLLAVIASSLRRERERAGLTLTELARRARIAKSTLSQLESATGNPSVETLWALGEALGIPFSRLVEPATPPIRLVPAGHGPRVPSEVANFAGTLLSAGSPQGRRDIYIADLEPGRIRRADAHIPGTVEHLIVAAGRIRTGPVDNVVELGPGDYVAFPGDVPHLYEALAKGSWAVLVMEHA
jgi:transcriptional regulator with XRE-family HTH domain